jgi:hypothetical protein
LRWAQQVTQLPQQHQREFHRQHERDQPSERRRDMTRQPTRATREARRIQAQRPSRREQHRPPDRDERYRQQTVRPPAREMRELRQRRERDQRWPRDDQHRQHDRHEHLQREQRRCEQHTDDHQERPEHTARPRQERSAEENPDDPAEPVTYLGEPEDRVCQRVRRRDNLGGEPPIDDEHERDPHTPTQSARGVRCPGEPEDPVPECPDRERDRQHHRGEIDHLSLKRAYVRPSGRVGQRYEMLDRRDAPVL